MYIYECILDSRIELIERFFTENFLCCLYFEIYYLNIYLKYLEKKV